MTEKPAFIQGVFTFEGNGLGKPAPFSQPATYGVPQDRRAQMIYFRAGNAAPELVCLVFACNGRTMRYFPVGAKSAMHVALAVVEDLDPGSLVEVLVSAPEGLKSTIVLDAGFLEIV